MQEIFDLKLDLSALDDFQWDAGEAIIGSSTVNDINGKKDLQKYYSNQCNKNHIDYVPLTTKQSLDVALTEYLKKRTRLN